MSIGAVFQRELMAIARRGGEPWGRSAFAGILLIVVLGVFASFYDQVDGMTGRLMAEAAERAFAIVLAVHLIAIVDVIGKSSRCIAEENDRRTLDFLLSTRLSNAEIVLGKLGACLAAFLGTVSAGPPIVLLLHRLGAVDLRLILLSYAALASLGIFLSSLSTWISATSPDSRTASARAILYVFGWLWGPFVVAFVLPRLGLRPPGWVLSVNAWLLASSPLSFFISWRGLGASPSLVDAIARMCGLQLALGLACLTAAILRLRSAYRTLVEGESRNAVGRFVLFARRSRPAVGDDPILWRERFTGRPEGFVRWLGLLINLMIAMMIACPTYYYARPALVELWHHGYLAGPTGPERPEFNIFVRFFFTSGSNAPADEARLDFNLFLRFIAVAMTFFTAIVATGNAVEAIAGERLKETWSSLLATPLSAHDILRSKTLASFWKMRMVLATGIILWTMGLATGAIHPVGFALCLMSLGAMTWFFIAWGLLCAVAAATPSRAANAGMCSTILLAISGGLPFFVPAKFSSVLLGAGSSPFVIWLAQLSYRDVRNAIHHASYPHLHWIAIDTGEGAPRVLLACLIGILAPALGGLVCWRLTLARFDRLVGRPWRGAVGEAGPASEAVPRVRTGQQAPASTESV